MGHEFCDDRKIKESLIATGSIFGADPDSIDLDFTIRDQGKNLSGGQKQAITLARSMAFDPNIMLLDEPTSGMDVKTESIVIEGMKRLCEEKTMVIITHKIALVSLCKRVIVIEQGKIIWDDTIEKYVELIKTQKK